MSNGNITKLRLQLLQRGYLIIPNIGKVPAVKGWNSQDYLDRELQPVAKGTVADRVARWPRRWPDAQTTGVRVEDGLVVLDLDIDDPLVDEVMVELMHIAPQVWQFAPTRFGASQHKMALFARLLDGEAFLRLASRSYDGHRVEIFGGAKLSGNRCSRQFGIYGPHSYDADGSVAAEYVWADNTPTLHEIDLKDLPVITRGQCALLVDAFERLAKAAGWQASAAPDTEAGSVVYDITEQTRFCTNRGDVDVDYAGLCDAWAVHGESLRCSRDFMPGRGDSGKTDTCLIGDANRHDVVAVFVPGDEVLHFPVELAGGTLDPEALAEQLKAAAAAAGQAVPIAAPNWRERYASGHPRASLHNARLAIEGLQIHCSIDVFHHRMYIGRSEASAPSERLPYFFGSVTDDSVGGLRMHLSNTFGLDFGEKHVRDAVVILAGENKFDPVVEMLAEAEASWDGVARLDHMAVDHFNTTDTPLNRQMVRKTLIAAVARARQPGCKFDTILVMESVEGWNKSSAWRLLAGDDNFSDQRVIGLPEREAQEQLSGVWIHENAELAGMRKAEVDMVKAFASRQEDCARPAYGRFLVAQPRQSIEIGTTNADIYLQSGDGNRRFWPIKVTSPIDLRKLRAARLQLWGEAAHYQAQGEALTLDEALWPAAGEAQEERRVRHPWEDLLTDLMPAPSSGPIAGMRVGGGLVHTVGTEWRVASMDIFEIRLKIQAERLERHHYRTLAEAMRNLGWERTTFKLNGKATKGYKRTVR